MASCVYSRLSSVIVNGTIPEPNKHRELKTGMLYMRYAKARNIRRFEDLKTNFDEHVVDVAKLWLKHDFADDIDWVLMPKNEKQEQ